MATTTLHRNHQSCKPPSDEDVARSIMGTLAMVRAWLGGGAPSSAAILTTDTRACSAAGYSLRMLEDAVRSGALVGVRVARGYRIEQANLQLWESARAERRRRPRRAAAIATTSPLERAAAADLDQISARRLRSVKGGAR